MRRDEGGREADGCRFEPRPGTDSPLFRNDKNPISSGTVAWKEGRDAFLPGRGGESLIEATDKMPPQASYFSGNRWLNRLVYGKHSWNFDLTFLD